MNKKQAVVAAGLALTLSGPALGPAPWSAQEPAPWQLINYYGGQNLSWWEESIISAGLMAGCGFIGAGVGMVTLGWGGILTAALCELGLEA